MPETRIALIMGGGVSLGSFSGGALAQIIRVLKYTKRGPAKIDVMSGASAGSMTLAVAAYLLFKGATDDEIEEALYNAWVEQIDLANLIPEEFEAHNTPSLFSDEIIQRIAEETIQATHWPDTPVMPHPLFAEGMKLSFSLTNLNGIPVRSEGQMIRQSVTGGGPATGKNSVFADALQTTFHHDQIRFELRRDTRSNAGPDNGIRRLKPWNTEQSKTEWKLFRKAAIASGAFPGAFPPVRLERYKDEYGKWWPEELGDGPFTFDYLDGGITRNEPLREAIRLAGMQDAGIDVERVFILVDPNVSGTNEVYPLPYNQELSLKKEYDKTGRPVAIHLEKPGYLAGLGGVAGRFATVLASQATYRDWLKAARYNSLIEWKEDLIDILASLKPDPDSEAHANIDRVLRKIYREKIVRTSSGENPKNGEAGIEEQIKHDIREQSDGGDISDADYSEKLKLLVNLVANLKGKQKLNMVAVTPASVEGGGRHRLAGNFLRGFGGFFEKKYRDYDFSVGKHIAACVLKAPVGNEKGEAKRLLKKQIELPEAPEPIIPNPAFQNVDESRRKMLAQFLKSHFDNAASALPGWTRLLWRFIRNRMVHKFTESLLSKSGGKTCSIVVRFRNVDRDWLLKGSTGNDAEVQGCGSVETVIGVRKLREGADQFELFGPHLHQNHENKVCEFQFIRKQRISWKNDEIKLSIPIKGKFAEWYKKAWYNSRPELICSLGDKKPVMTPAQVGSDHNTS